jgi:uncharacterized protein (TIGR03000 family)
MFRQTLAHFSVPAVALTALVGAADTALAQRNGSNHGGGGHGGGSVGHVSGGAHPGGFSGGARAGGIGGPIHPTPSNARVFANAATRGGFRNGFEHRHGAVGGYPGAAGGWYGGPAGGVVYNNAYYFGSASNAPTYAAAPNYGVSGYFGDADGYFPAYSDAASDASGNAMGGEVALGGFTAPEPREQPPTNPTAATVRVLVPADAEVWFDDTKMTLTGTLREYVTPPLTADQDYSYTIRARWTANGRVYDQSHKISFRPAQAILVDFVTPAPSTGHLPAPARATP